MNINYYTYSNEIGARVSLKSQICVWYMHGIMSLMKTDYQVVSRRCINDKIKLLLVSIVNINLNIHNCCLVFKQTEEYGFKIFVRLFCSHLWHYFGIKF